MDQVSRLSCHEDNLVLKEFYERNQDFFLQVPVSILKADMIRKIAVKLHNGKMFDHEWKIYASEMGIADNYEIAVIEESAILNRELALYITMEVALKRINGKLENIIKALLNKNRYDILRIIQPDIEELLEKYSATEAKQFISEEGQVPCIMSRNFDLPFKGSDLMNNESVPSLKSLGPASSEYFSAAIHQENIMKPTRREFDVLQKNFDCPDSSFELKLLPSSNVIKNSEEDLQRERHFSPSAPSEENLYVFIQHTESDIKIAKQLSIEMKEAGIKVKTSYEMERIVPFDCAGALSTIIQEVDFVVPVVSRSFLSQIHPQIYDKYIECTDAINNRSLYQQLQTEYRNNRCVNFRVRPILVPEMNRRLLAKLTKDVILSYSFLWIEMPKLIRILKETKELIPQYPF